MPIRAFLLAALVATPVAAEHDPGALRLASQMRAQAGLPALRHDPRLLAAAEMQARHMATRGKIGHGGPRGADLGDRIRLAGYRACVGAENVAMGQRTASEVTQGWMGSRGHRRNILDRRVTHGAVAKVKGPKGRLWWAMVLARPC